MPHYEVQYKDQDLAKSPWIVTDEVPQRDMAWALANALAAKGKPLVRVNYVVKSDEIIKVRYPRCAIHTFVTIDICGCCQRIA